MPFLVAHEYARWMSVLLLFTQLADASVPMRAGKDVVLYVTSAMLCCVRWMVSSKTMPHTRRCPVLHSTGLGPAVEASHIPSPRRSLARHIFSSGHGWRWCYPRGLVSRRLWSEQVWSCWHVRRLVATMELRSAKSSVEHRMARVMVTMPVPAPKIGISGNQRVLWTHLVPLAPKSWTSQTASI